LERNGCSWQSRNATTRKVWKAMMTETYDNARPPRLINIKLIQLQLFNAVQFFVLGLHKAPLSRIDFFIRWQLKNVSSCQL
jgi:hypothetical protein